MGRKRDIQIAEMVGKPIAEKMDALAESVLKDGEQTRAEYREQIDGINSIMNVIIEELSEKEKKDLYDLNTLADINSLEDTERRFLVELLYTLANLTEQVNEAQQAFIRSVQKNLGVRNVQAMVDLSFVDNIENISVQKAMLQVVMEFLFLENNNHDYIADYEDVLSHFSVNRNGLQQLQTAITNIYKGTGAQGLIEKYGFAEGYKNSIVQSDIDELKGILTAWREIDFLSIEVTLALTGLIEHTLNTYYYEDDIKTMYSCKRKAEAMLRSAYDDAALILNPFSFNGLCSRLPKEYYERYIERDLTKIQHIIRKLRDSGCNQEKLDMIEQYMNPTELQEKIATIFRDERYTGNYSLSSFEAYTPLIEYEEWDMTGMDTKGIFKLIAAAAGNVYYQYNCSEAWRKIEEEVEKKANMYADAGGNAVTNMLIRKYIEPVEYLLEELRRQ